LLIPVLVGSRRILLIFQLRLQGLLEII
jgi:hypothetical protein